MAEIDGGHLFAKALKHEGVEYVFTLNGGHIYNLYEGCDHFHSNLKIPNARHDNFPKVYFDVAPSQRFFNLQSNISTCSKNRHLV